MTEFCKELEALCRQTGYDVSGQALEKMNAYYDCMVETNAKYNLTAITQPQDAACKHFFDSIVPYRQIPKGAAVVDIGSGPGFPIAPLKAVREDILAVAIESSQKKCNFIENASFVSGIEVEVICARAEEAGQGRQREAFDVCVSRAVAALPVLMELCSPLVKNHGLFFAYKGKYQEELKNAGIAMKALNLELEEVIAMPYGTYEHNVLVFRKKGMLSPKYPRRYAQIIKSPL